MLRYSPWLLLLATCLAAAPLAAQNQPQQVRETGPGRVTGAIVDETGAPVAAAAVTLLAAGGADSTAVAQALTSELGRFRLDGVPLGRYLLRIAHIGYAPLTTDEVVLTAAAPAADVGALRLAAQAIALDAIEAAAERAPVVL